MVYLSTSESETLAFAARFAADLKPGDVVGLQGPLGAGKTLFCEGVVRALGYDGPVSSPTYALVHEYAGTHPIHHIDLYRLKENADWEEIGMGHYMDGKAICLIEWPERLPVELRRFSHQVVILPEGETRRRIILESGKD